jgi:hypothetical protein
MLLAQFYKFGFEVLISVLYDFLVMSKIERDSYLLTLCETLSKMGFFHVFRSVHSWLIILTEVCDGIQKIAESRLTIDASYSSMNIGASLAGLKGISSSSFS